MNRISMDRCLDTGRRAGGIYDDGENVGASMSDVDIYERLDQLLEYANGHIEAARKLIPECKAEMQRRRAMIERLQLERDQLIVELVSIKTKLKR
jgi:hypothetical protein